jgi:hypothetical protein
MATKGDISDLDHLIYGGKPIVPQVAVGGYSRTKNSGVVRSDTTGGATRQRKKYFGNVHVADVVFYFDTPSQQDFIEMFVERNEGKKWVCNLMADRPIVEPYVVQTVSEWSYSDINAQESTMSITLEIFSVREPVLDDFMFTLYGTIGDDSPDWINAWQLVNEVIPVE